MIFCIFYNSIKIAECDADSKYEAIERVYNAQKQKHTERQQYKARLKNGKTIKHTGKNIYVRGR